MSLRRIAQQAKVSLCTASMALRQHPRISVQTRRRVLAVAKRMGYRPDAKVAELMNRVRLNRGGGLRACLGVISLYETARPWETSLHLKRIYSAMTARAEALGYRLEPFWLRAPGMTTRRFRAILDARGVEGLLCLGSPQIDAEFPSGFDRCAIVTQGLSIRTPLHRVINHAYKNIWRALDRVHQLGYRRPGLAIGRYIEERSAHSYLSGYLGWSKCVLGDSAAIPVLILEGVEEARLLAWLQEQRPDVMIYVHHFPTLPELAAVLERNRRRLPAALAVAVISQIIEGSGFSGLQENQQMMGAWAVELLVARLMNSDLGIPSTPRIEMVESNWIDGRTLPPRAGGRGGAGSTTGRGVVR